MRSDLFAVALGAVLTIVGGASAQEKAQEGEKIFKRTYGACHTVEPGKHRVGPSLAGVVGRKAGTTEGFKYSDAMKNANIAWSEDNLDKYLTDPKGFLPGNKMAYTGLKKENDRKAVIEYLESVKAAAGAS